MQSGNKVDVSVVMPAYNCEGTLEESVYSILDQTYEDFELIIVNDASTDETLSVAMAIANKDSRIRVVSQEVNRGVGAARERGIHESSGKYICWQDADDIAMPDRIEKQLAFLEEHPGVGVVGGFIQFFDETGDGVIRTYAESDRELRAKIFRYNPVAQPASMFRRECFEKVGYYDPTLLVDEDLDMFFRVGEVYEFGNVQQVVLKYRQSTTSLTASRLREMEVVALKLRQKYRKSDKYNYTMADALFNMAQRATMFIPSKIRIELFKIIRGDK